ncbi:hypothetical protein OQA88_1966 [Cercophora sp. LCS_1]
MKSFIGYALASAALVTAQVSHNETTGEFLCAKADAAYCAGDSLGTDIIIRCTGTKGQPGRCTNNLAGYPPLGVQPALCWQSSDTAGDAACEKNCVVYAPSSSWTLPSSQCTPYYTATSTSTADSTTTTTIIESKPTSSHATTKKSSTVTTVVTETCNETTSTTTSIIKPTHSPTHNITTTPISTTKPTGQPPVTAGAVANNAVGALALVGLVAAYVF